VSSPVLKSAVNPQTPDFQKNSRRMIELLTSIKNQEEQIRHGGGTKAIESQHKKNRLTARERIAKLVDPGTPFFELAMYAAHEMYEEWGGAPSAGTVTGLARVVGRLFMMIAIFVDEYSDVIPAREFFVRTPITNFFAKANHAAGPTGTVSEDEISRKGIVNLLAREESLNYSRMKRGPCSRRKHEGLQIFTRQKKLERY
jgi:Carboxyl transferase domain